MIGKAVRDQRVAVGWSQRALAARAGIGLASVSRIEDGKQSPTIDTLILIAKAFDIPVTDLIYASTEERTDG